MEKVVVVARSFQTGTGEGGKAFDAQVFERQVARPISRLLKDDSVKNIIVVVNGELGSKLAELSNKNGDTPTMLALRERFPNETNRIITVLCTDWGPNPGSAIALNKGLEIASKDPNIKWVLNWSPNIENESLSGFPLGHGRASRAANLGY